MGVKLVAGTLVAGDCTSEIIRQQSEIMRKYGVTSSNDARAWHTGDINTIDEFEEISATSEKLVTTQQIQDYMMNKAQYINQGQGLLVESKDVLGYEIYHFEEDKLRVDIYSEDLRAVAPTHGGYTVVYEYYGCKLHNQKGVGAKTEFYDLEEAKSVAYQYLKFYPGRKVLILGSKNNSLVISPKVRRVKETTQRTEFGQKVKKVVLPVHTYYYIGLASC